MFLLWILGRGLEPALGSLNFALLYFTSLLAGSFGVLLVDPGSLTVGASGAVFGLMGVTVVYQRRHGGRPVGQRRRPGWCSINLVITFLIPGISIGGHVGGLIGGAIGGFLVLEAQQRVRSAVAPVIVCVVLAAALVAGCLWAASQWMDPIL